MVVSDGMKPILIGVAMGLAAALALSRLVASLVFGVHPTDPLTFSAVAVILITVGCSQTLSPLTAQLASNRCVLCARIEFLEHAPAKLPFETQDKPFETHDKLFEAQDRAGVTGAWPHRIAGADGLEHT